MKNISSKYTVVGTNIDEVKMKNAQSGMSYNEVKELLAKTTGGSGTLVYSDINKAEIKSKNQQSSNNKQ
jgi:hypothetical protein